MAPVTYVSAQSLKEREKNKTSNDSWKIRYYLKEVSSYLGLSPSIDFYVHGQFLRFSVYYLINIRLYASVRSLFFLPDNLSSSCFSGA